MSDFDLVLCGTLVLPDGLVPRGFVAVSDGKVAMVGRGAAPSARVRHDLGEAVAGFDGERLARIVGGVGGASECPGEPCG